MSLSGYFEWTERVTIKFPLLEYLSIHDLSRNPDVAEWVIFMVTPSLISYSFFSEIPASRLPHRDVKSVIYFQSRHIPDLAPFTSLRVLLVWSTPKGPTPILCASKLAEQLRQDINICPALQLVEFQVYVDNEEEKSESITRIMSARPGTEVLFTNHFRPMPGSRESSVGVLPSTSSSCNSCL
jgi:hypothetical protein